MAILAGHDAVAGVDERNFANLCYRTSNAFPVEDGRKVAVSVISQFGEETTKVLKV